MKRILVIQGGKLGDMVCTTPVFHAIKEKFPQSQLLVMGDGLNEQVLKGNPYIDEYYYLKNSTRADFRKMKVDVAILLNPIPKILWQLLLARATKIIAPKVTGGFSPYYTKTYRMFLSFVTKAEHRMGHYAPQEYLNALQKIGIENSDTRKELFVDEEAVKKINGILRAFEGKRFIAIAPGAGNKIKEWPSERFNEVAQYLIKKTDTIIVIVGGSGDTHLANVVKNGIPEERILDMAGKLSIEELKALVQRMNLFISVDTGPIYIAEAFGVPTIDIIGPIDENEQPPIGEKHIVVLPRNRIKPVLHVMNARIHNQHEAIRLAQSATVDDVIAAIEKIYEYI